MTLPWDPALYRRHDDHRARPFLDLVARVGASAPREVVDLGCGPGHLTGVLAQLREHLGEEARAFLHWGATTQDIMDSGLALQLDAAMALLERRLRSLGDALEVLVTAHEETVILV